MREHLLAAHRAGAPLPAALKDQPALPPEFAPLLSVLSRFPPPLDWAQIEAWARMTGRSFALWELDVIETIDRMRR